MISLGLNPEEFKKVQNLLSTLGAKARFGASVGLNRTANEVQDEVRKGLSGQFTLRRKAFIENTIYRKPREDFATKDNLKAGVRINPERDVLAKFEDGGSKTPREGKSIAVPLGARPSPTSIVPQRYTLKALFFGQQGLASQAKSVFKARTKSRRKLLLKRSTQDDIFIRNGVVFQAPPNHRGKPKALWVFKSSTKLPQSLHFMATAFRVARDRLAVNVSGAIEVEVARGLTTKSGAMG